MTDKKKETRQRLDDATDNTDDVEGHGLGARAPEGMKQRAPEGLGAPRRASGDRL